MNLHTPATTGGNERGERSSGWTIYARSIRISLPCVDDDHRLIARSIAINEKRAWYARHGAGRTFVQDGFDARTGDEREPGEQRARTRARWSDGEGGGASERARGRREREKERKRKAKRRKLKPATGLRNVRIRHSGAQLTVNEIPDSGITSGP